jgi:hypothetical protein
LLRPSPRSPRTSSCPAPALSDLFARAHLKSCHLGPGFYLPVWLPGHSTSIRAFCFDAFNTARPHCLPESALLGHGCPADLFPQHSAFPAIKPILIQSHLRPNQNQSVRHHVPIAGWFARKGLYGNPILNRFGFGLRSVYTVYIRHFLSHTHRPVLFFAA